jgi:hypothetical protein
MVQAALGKKQDPVSKIAKTKKGYLKCLLSGKPWFKHQLPPPPKKEIVQKE